MQVTINVDESMFKDVVEKELKALTPDELRSIIFESIAECLRMNNYEAVKHLILTEKTSYGYKTYEPNSFTMELIQQCDYSKLQDVVDVMIEKLVADHERILKDIILDTIIKGFDNTYTIRETLKNSVLGIINH